MSGSSSRRPENESNLRILVDRAAKRPVLSAGALVLVVLLAVVLVTSLGSGKEEKTATLPPTETSAVAGVSSSATPLSTTSGSATQSPDVGSATVDAAAQPTGVPSATPVPSPTPIPATSVKDYGAKGDGVADDTEAITQAVAEAPRIVVFPAGDYRITGEIRPRDGQELRFESGARLIQYADENILHLEGVQNVKIVGAVLHHTGNVKPGGRSDIRVTGSHNLEFRDIVVERSDGWAFYILPSAEFGESHDILIDGYRNTNRDYQNGNIDDGLDIIGYNITVRNFDISTNDDAISVKAYSGRETYNITIENGVIRSRDGGLTFGTEVGPGGIHDVIARNLTFEGVGVPIYFKAYDPGAVGEIYNIQLANIIATGGAQRFLFFHSAPERANKIHDVTVNGARFSGPAEFDCILIQRQRNITLSNVTCEAGQGSKNGLSLRDASSSHFENLTFDGYQRSVVIGGANSVGNTFVGMLPQAVTVESGASLGAQAFSGVPQN